MIYEVIGLTGAGKSYWSKKYAAENGLQYISILDRKQRYKYALLFILRRPAFVAQLSWMAFMYSLENPKILKHKLLLIMLTAYAKEYLAITRKSSVVIDNGILQFLFSIYERKISSSETNLDSLFFSLSEREVFEIVSPKTIRDERMRERGRSLRGDFTKEERTKYATIFEHNYVILSKKLAKKFNTIKIENV